MAEEQSVREDLSVPDRFEMLRDVGNGTLRNMVVPVEDSLDALESRFLDCRAAGRGGMVILRGDAGVGKSTFLDTVGFFREGVTTERIPPEVDVSNALRGLSAAGGPRVVVVEGREALLDVSNAALETSMHAINAFSRSAAGRESLVVWPTNKDDLADSLATLGQQLGGSALLGVGEPILRFTGPPREEFVDIGVRTVGALNDGASLVALGVSDERAAALAGEAGTVGDFLARLRGELLANSGRVRGLLKKEQPRLWIVVIAGNDPEGDVAALTRGGYSYADIDRLMSATGANIVGSLKREPDTVGILSTVLDTRVLHVDKLTALAIARTYAGEPLKAAMRAEGMQVNADSKAPERVLGSELGLVLNGATLGVKRRGSKPGGSTMTAFNNLAIIAQNKDGLLNAAIGTALVANGLADRFVAEKQVGTSPKFFSDLAIRKGNQDIRIEVMWRKTTGRAEISNYVLTKLGNYAKAIGLLPA